MTLSPMSTGPDASHWLDPSSMGVVIVIVVEIRDLRPGMTLNFHWSNIPACEVLLSSRQLMLDERLSGVGSGGRIV